MESPHLFSEHGGALEKSPIFRAIADCTYDWESWHAPNGKLQWVNAAVQRMTGVAPGECLSMEDYPLPLVEPSYRPQMARVMREAIEGGSGNDVEFLATHQEDVQRWMAISWQPMFDASGTHLGFRTSIRDVTERHQLREELRIHNRHLEQLVQERTAQVAELEKQRLQMEKLAALGQLAAGVAHEVNNPLAGIRNAFALFRSGVSDEHEHAGLLDLIDNEIERISAITHQMYQLYRPSQQAIRAFDITRVIEEVLALLEPVLRKANVWVDHRMKSGVSSGALESTQVFLREGELKQILFNLVCNAIQASDCGDTVTILYATTPDKVVLSVLDQGEGIAPEVLPYIFDPFFSTKSNTSREGLGLGLSVSRSLVEAMGGEIHVQSTLHAGSEFELILPRAIDELTQGNSISSSNVRS
ncbi:sensor histidine kinase [Bremerella alba]|uniref:histidine kinase n=1 Tax=Bremerella alba TaxID=980252 RepID=A0A7V9A7S6_9BACT|nr:ATP-binding protein [Bremerella alba]MBA2115311.1 Adaptive-response sensory-kinase SasA [Bremerella alba]